MKKWIIALCCVVIAAGATIGIIISNHNRQVSELQDTLTERQAQIDKLTAEVETAAETAQETIKNLNRKISHHLVFYFWQKKILRIIS